VPASVKYIAVIIIAWVVSTFIVSTMLPRVPMGGCHASRRITLAEMQDIDQLCGDANAMAEHNVFFEKCSAIPLQNGKS
jgi:hypothetical protein